MEGTCQLRNVEVIQELYQLYSYTHEIGASILSMAGPTGSQLPT